jgi:hypothetical protein
MSSNPPDDPMDPSVVRVPDGIEPISGYRCWSYSVSPVGVSLLPLRQFLSGPSASSAWAGAESQWVAAHCSADWSIWPPSPSEILRAILTNEYGEEGVVPKSSPSHAVPKEDCSCGFYAMRDLDRDLVDMSRFGLLADRTQVHVLGRVLLAGKVIEHARGYRAERARIAELIPVKGTEGTVASLAAALGLPLGAAV